MSEKGEDIMKQKITTLLLLLCLAIALFAGCSAKNTGQEIIDGAKLSEEEREAYILEKIVGSGSILSSTDYQAITKAEGEADHIDGKCLVYEDNNFALYYSFKDTSISVKDKRGATPTFYHSGVSGFTTNRATGVDDYFSNIVVEAYDASNKKYEFASLANCVDGDEEGRYRKFVKMGDGWFRIVYTIGNDADKQLAPPALRKETFDGFVTKLYSLMAQATAEGDSQMAYKYKQMISDLATNYQGLGPEKEEYHLDASEETSGMKWTIYELSRDMSELYARTYPLVTVRPMYVLRSGTTMVQKSNIKAAMEAVGFTVDDLKKELDAVEYSGPARAVLYVIPVDIKINEDGVSFEVDSSLILGPKEQKLYRISLFPYFGAENADDSNEYVIFPDGSGSYMAQTGSLYPATQRQRIYGTDSTFSERILSEITAPALSGYFVYNRGEDGGFLATLDNGAGHAFVRATNGQLGKLETCSTACFELIYIERDFRTYEKEKGQAENLEGDVDADSSKAKSDKVKASGVITSKYRLDTVFRTRYVFDVISEQTGEDFVQKTYAEYAKQYRKHLQDAGKFPTEKLQSDSLTFYLDLLGAVDVTENIAGFPVTRKKALTSYEQAGKIVDELLAEGMDGSSMVLRYLSWSNDGLYNSVSDSVRLMREMGSQDQLKALIAKLDAEQIGFFPSADFLTVGADALNDAFNATEDAARRLDMSIARIGFRDPADGTYMWSYQKLLSPAASLRYSESYRASYEKTVGIKNIALAGFGERLNSDYRNTDVYTRVRAQEVQEQILKTYWENGYKIMAQVGNDYVWKYASYITDVPVGGSGNLSTSYPVPFIQMVLHGYIDYCTAPLNESADYTTALLTLLETGSGVHFRWDYAEDSIYQDTDFNGFYYSLNYNNSLENAVRLYKEAASILNRVASSEIVGHEKLKANVRSSYIGDIEEYPQFSLVATDGVYQTTYENGLQIIVNYNPYDIELEDEARTTVAAYSYIYREGEEGTWQK